MTTQIEEKNGIGFIVTLLITIILCSFIFLVLANVAGTALAAVLGIGKAVTTC